MRIFKVSLSLKRTLVDTTDWQTLHSKYSSEEEVVLQHFAKDKLAMIPHQNSKWASLSQHVWQSGGSQATLFCLNHFSHSYLKFRHPNSIQQSNLSKSSSELAVIPEHQDSPQNKHKPHVFQPGAPLCQSARGAIKHSLSNFPLQPQTLNATHPRARTREQLLTVWYKR